MHRRRLTQSGAKRHVETVTDGRRWAWTQAVTVGHEETEIHEPGAVYA